MRPETARTLAKIVTAVLSGLVTVATLVAFFFSSAIADFVAGGTWLGTILFFVVVVALLTALSVVEKRSRSK